MPTEVPVALVPCPSCDAHLVEGTPCPHCGAPSRRVGLARTTSVMLLLGLSLGADCGAKEQPLYGVAITGDTGDTDGPDDTDDTDAP